MKATDIERFLTAQDHYAYETALEEIKEGHKQSHWIWYIFPQIRGLGHSPMSQMYGIASLAEAKAYLEEPTLAARLREITGELLKHKDMAADDIFGGLDATKVRSCMTLFDLVSPSDIFEEVLDTFYDGKRCRRTLRIVQSEKV